MSIGEYGLNGPALKLASRFVLHTLQTTKACILNSC